jgi:hypothetical protein
MFADPCPDFTPDELGWFRFRCFLRADLPVRA